MTSARSPRTTAADIERELREMKASAPPADLAAKIQLEIPDSDELARAAVGAAAKPNRPIPWLRLAATLAIAGLAATVAWQTLRQRDREALAPAAEPRGRELDDIADIRPTAELQQPATKRESQRTANEEKLLVKERERSDLAADAPTILPLPALFEESRAAAVATPKPAELGRADEIRDEAVAAGVEGGVSGGVHGGAPGGVPSGVVAAEPVDVLGESVTVTAESPALAAKVSAQARPDSSLAAGRALPATPKPEARKRAAVAEPSPVSREFEAPLRVGGRVEPEAPGQPDTMIFRDAGVNRFVITADDRLSTFALDVDTGSYSLARSYLERGTLPPAEAIRLEEFVNAMRYSDAAPRRDDFALHAEGSESPYPDAAGLSLLRFAVRAREVEPAQRKPANLTFVVDVSGSMDRENRLGLVKRALGLLLDELTRDDRVGLVVYGTQGRILLRHTDDHGAIREAIARLVPDGSTNAEEGLRLGYDLADAAWVKGSINRIILCSDGVANVGATGPESILARIGEQARRGIQLTTVGFGMGNYNDALMERLANQGDGTYHYVDQLDEARKVFVENLTGTLQNVAKDAKIQVEFDPRTVERWRLLGYENRDVADRDFRNDAVDAGEVGAGQSATALYEVRLRSGARPGDRVARLQVRWKSVDGRPAGEVRELARDLRVSEVGHRVDRASRDLRLAALAAAFAEKLKATRAGVELTWSELTATAGELARDFPRDGESRELARLIDRAAALAAEGERPRRDGFPDGERDREPRGNGRLDEPR